MRKIMVMFCSVMVSIITLTSVSFAKDMCSVQVPTNEGPALQYPWIKMPDRMIHRHLTLRRTQKFFELTSLGNPWDI